MGRSSAQLTLFLASTTCIHYVIQGSVLVEFLLPVGYARRSGGSSWWNSNEGVKLNQTLNILRILFYEVCSFKQAITQFQHWGAPQICRLNQTTCANPYSQYWNTRPWLQIYSRAYFLFAFTARRGMENTVKFSNLREHFACSQT
jgi:hypothetical protein